ncbi:translocation protein TolB [Poriferisphaera corsica]|uniref:Translocation protein TolB n=1 Tax=Poriferisphaera corsica TaxID=2528020 RepID=A0A517YSK2_9BACT|nr:DPP IV N-terminal domain-containing protein [Poriferisphaera corsica]QDU33198.1 translocation protein TolB [Poriferisphaera corsica]
MKRLTSLAALLAASATLIAGCTQSYNGGLGFTDSLTSPLEVREYQKLKKEQATQLQSGRMTQKRAGRVDFGDSTIAPTDRGMIYNTASTSVDQLGMYGQIDASQSHSAISPMDAGGNASKITNTEEGGDFDPEINRSGQWMVYSSTRHRQTADIYKKRLGSASLIQLTNDPAEDRMPTFSPDGKLIAFSSNRSGNWDIYIMDSDGGPARQLTSSNDLDEIHPSFSPDGSKLVYCTFGGPSGQMEMVVIDINSPTTKRFIGYGTLPAWSPSDNTILFQRARERGTRWYSIWSVTLLENGNVTPPTELVSSANAAAITPNWSPDGKYIVFCTVIDPESDDYQRMTKADVWVMNADGSGRARVTAGPYAHQQPAWSADGSILFVSDRAGEEAKNIWSLRPDRALRLASPGNNNLNAPSVMVPTQ